MKTIIICPNCKKDNYTQSDDVSIFCSHCGKSINGKSSTSNDKQKLQSHNSVVYNYNVQQNYSTQTSNKYQGDQISHAPPSVNTNLNSYVELANNALNAENYAEGIRYFNKVLEINTKNSNAWYGKGYCIGWSGNLSDIKVNEMVLCYQNSMQYCSPDDTITLGNKIAEAINKCAFVIYSMSYQHTVEFARVDNTYREHLNRSIDVLHALEYAYSLNKTSKQIVATIIKICANLSEPIRYRDYDDKPQTLSIDSNSMARVETIRKKYFDIMAKIDPEFLPAIKSVKNNFYKLMGLTILGTLFIFIITRFI